MLPTNRPRIPGIDITDELGRGANSVVYRGRIGGAPCAVKLPRVRARWTRWIYREAVALARVKHRALPNVLEVGEDDGLPYLAMELVAGETLGERLRSTTLDERAAIALFRELLDALAAVHDAGLVHRDVKPRNIIIEADTGALKLVDFGFATPIERAGVEDLAGTRAYAAPEQFVAPGRVDGRADLYAVGRVLVECLTGSLSAGNDESGASRSEVRPRLAAFGVSDHLSEILSGVLREKREERYPDARAVMRELARLERNEPPHGPRAYASHRGQTDVAAHAAELAHTAEFLERRVGGDGEDDTQRGGAVVVVTGAPGAGKTRLLSAAAAAAAELGVVADAKCTREDPPLATLRRLLERRASTMTHDEVAAKLGRLAPLAAFIAPALAPDGASSVSPPPMAGGAETLAEAAAEILLRLAVPRPLVLVVDDIQWMDPASADALLRVAHRAGEAPLVLLFGSRAGDSASLASRIEAAAPRHSLRVHLGPLSEHQTAALVGSHLGADTVNPALARRVHAMADGTALGVLEVLGAFLDEGAVRPQAGGWLFDVVRAERVVLPRGALALLGRRLDELPPATQRVLEAAAVLGTAFADDLLARVVGLSVDDVGYGLAGARRAGLIEAASDSQHRFVHDTVREMVIERLDGTTRRRLHQTAGEALAATGLQTAETLCAIALHLVNGEVEKDPRGVLAACRAAARAALDRFSNDTALDFLERARDAAARVGEPLGTEHHREVGEAQLRLGQLDASLASFQRALESTSDPQERATLLGRLAWVYQTRAEPTRASEMLARAFDALGVPMPTGTVRSAARTALAVGGSAVRRWTARERRGASPVDLELLSTLHYQNARLGLEYGEPLRLVQSSAVALELSKQGVSARATAHARAMHAFVLMNLRQRSTAAREFERAEKIANDERDPVTTVFCLQLRSSAALYAGEHDLGIQLARECIDTFAPWLELNEFCYHISNLELIQSLRGRTDEAWPWIERGLERLRRSNAPPAIAQYLVHRARATMASLDKAPTSAWLADQLEAVAPHDGGHGFHRLLSWGPRARWFVDRADLGDKFEGLMHEFTLEHPNARTAHPVLCELYVAVAHARMFQVLRTAADARKPRVDALRTATENLGIVAKMPLLQAHHLVARGCLAWLDGDARGAAKHLAGAERLADEQSCPWVLYEVERVRAHMLREEGRGDAARDHALVAETLATQHGAVQRARWIREEFALPAAFAAATVIVPAAPSGSMSRRTKQLAALLEVVHAPRRDLDAEQQATRIVEELMDAASASAGGIWFRPEPNTTGVAVLRHSGSDVSVEIGFDSPRGMLLRHVHETGVAWPPLGQDGGELQAHPFDPSRVIAVPLQLYDKAVGALCVERRSGEAPFTPDDRALLEQLSHQVPPTLEIARLLFERDQLEASLQHAKKMEAIGQLAGGIAHDFNNMLAAVHIAVSRARGRATRDAELATELEVIEQATSRAAQLTAKLLGISRRTPGPRPVPHNPNAIVSGMDTMLRRIVGANVHLVTDLAPDVHEVMVDEGAFVQALLNLCVNARDAMPGGGTLAIRTRNVVLGEGSARRLDVPPGDYVELEIRDDGQGMSPDTLTRIFEPFFTTKAPGSGTGLGLTSVYAFARSTGGAIEATSEVGRGTQLRLHLKACSPAVSKKETQSMRRVEGAGADTILVVDDDALVRRSVALILEQHGYRVLAASCSAEALEVARQHGARLALIILDVSMPGLNGPELGRHLVDLKIGAKQLFVSGFSADALSHANAVSADTLLQKPFSQDALLERVRELMPN